MNVLETLAVKKTPYLFLYTSEPITLSRIELSHLPAVISEVVGMSISAVKPIEKVGRVALFDVTPHRTQDPPLLFSRALDLSQYYILWNITITGGCNNLLYQWEEMMNALKIKDLDTDEAAFLILKMLDFKNEYVRRV